MTDYGSEEPQPTPQVEPPPTVELQVTTAKTKDYLGRLLVTPATAGKDFLGRSIVAVDKDFLGRALV